MLKNVIRVILFKFSHQRSTSTSGLQSNPLSDAGPNTVQEQSLGTEKRGKITVLPALAIVWLDKVSMT